MLGDSEVSSFHENMDSIIIMAVWLFDLHNIDIWIMILWIYDFIRGCVTICIRHWQDTNMYNIIYIEMVWCRCDFDFMKRKICHLQYYWISKRAFISEIVPFEIISLINFLIMIKLSQYCTCNGYSLCFIRGYVCQVLCRKKKVNMPWCTRIGLKSTQYCQQWLDSGLVLAHCGIFTEYQYNVCERGTQRGSQCLGQQILGRSRAWDLYLWYGKFETRDIGFSREPYM